MYIYVCTYICVHAFGDTVHSLAFSSYAVHQSFLSTEEKEKCKLSSVCCWIDPGMSLVSFDMCGPLYVHPCVCMSVYLYLCVRVCVCVCVCVCV